LHRRLASLAILPCALLVACATNRAPDLSRLYSANAADREAVPIVLVPGVLGSRLARSSDGLELWPGSTRKLLTSRYLDLAMRIDPEMLEPLDDGIVASGLFDGAVGKDFYGRIVEALREVGGYRLSSPGQPVVEHRARLYFFTYDWRQDNVVTVRRLDALVEQIRQDYGDPALRVDVIAHSMGGLIVRYYERYGTDDVLDRNSFPVTGAGVGKLRRIVMLGTPNQGTVTAVHKFLNGYRVALSSLPVEGVATMPAMFQLFPHPLVDWITTIDGRPLARDLFDVTLWRRFQWSIFDPRVQRRMHQEPGVWPDQGVFERWFEKRLERARRFVWSLMVPTGDIELIEPLMFGGDCVPTPRRLVVEEVDGDSVARLRPEQILEPVPGIDYEALMFEPGDGSVTKSSLLARQQLHPSVPRHEYSSVEVDRAFFVCERHETLTGNINFLDNMLNFLLSAD
jgi:pimeloyl-ACP methyl ester carboxylesterase